MTLCNHSGKGEPRKFSATTVVTTPSLSQHLPAPPLIPPYHAAPWSLATALLKLTTKKIRGRDVSGWARVLRLRVWKMSWVLGYGDPYRLDLGNVLVDEFYLVFLNMETCLSLRAFGNETLLVYCYEVKEYERRFCRSLALRRDFGSSALPLRIHALPSIQSSRSSYSPTIRSNNLLVLVR